MKQILTIIILLSSCFTALSQERDKNSKQEKDSIYKEVELEKATISKQRYITARGYTRDDNGKILPEVTLTHGSGKNRRETTSDKDGYFRMDSVKASSAFVRFTKLGYVSLAYKFKNTADVENVRLAFDPNGVNQEYDFGILKDTKLKSASNIKMVQGETLRKYTSSSITFPLTALFGAGWEQSSLIVFNGISIQVNSADELRRTLDSYNINDIAAIAFIPVTSAAAAIYGSRAGGGRSAIGGGGGRAGVIVVRTK